MSELVGCVINLRHESASIVYIIKLAHYDEIRDALDRHETGWREFDSVHGDGKVLCRMEDICDVFASTPQYKEARDAWEAEQRAEKMANGE